MENEWKRAMKLIWGHKRYKAILGPHPLIIAIGMLCAIFGGLYPLITKMAGEPVNELDGIIGGVIPTFLYMILFVNLGNQYQVILSSGKSLFSMPVARSVLTKGLLIGRLICMVVMLVLTVMLSQLCVWMELCEKVAIDDVVIMYGIVYVLTVLAAGFSWAGSVLGVSSGVILMGNVIGSVQTSDITRGWMEKAYSYDIPWWLVLLVFAVLSIGGTRLGLMILEKTYERRIVVLPLEQRVAQR